MLITIYEYFEKNGKVRELEEIIGAAFYGTGSMNSKICSFFSEETTNGVRSFEDFKMECYCRALDRNEIDEQKDYPQIVNYTKKAFLMIEGTGDKGYKLREQANSGMSLNSTYEPGDIGDRVEIGDAISSENLEVGFQTMYSGTYGEDSDDVTGVVYKRYAGMKYNSSKEVVEGYERVITRKKLMEEVWGRFA